MYNKIREILKRYNLRKKYIVGFSLTLSMITIYIIMSNIFIVNVGGKAEKIYNISYKKTNIAWSINDELQGLNENIYKLVNEFDEGKNNKYIGLAKVNQEKIEKNIEEFKSLLDKGDDVSTPILEEITSVLKGIISEKDNIIKLISEGNMDEAENRLDSVYSELINKCKVVSKELYNNADVEALNLMNSAKKTKLISNIIAIALGVSIVLVSVFMIRLINTLLLEGINHVVKICENLNKGILEPDYSYESNDEIGVMVNSLNEAIEVLKTYIKDEVRILTTLSSGILDIEMDETIDYRGDFGEIKNSFEIIIQSLNEIFKDINGSSKLILMRSQDISSTTELLSIGSISQVESVDELLINFSKSSIQIRNNMEDVNKVEAFLNETKELVYSGTNDMNKLKESMKEINKVSIEIGAIIKTIEDIAEQVDLIAINAAIESNRAGNEGRGFMVISNEVRRLSDKVKIAASDTNYIINSTIDKTNIGNGLAYKASQSLGVIVKNVDKTVDLTRKIAKEYRGQSAVLINMEGVVNEISQVIESNSMKSEEIAATSKELVVHVEKVYDGLSKYKIKD